jgi:nucleotide-binding universal stress UspA family protein
MSLEAEVRHKSGKGVVITVIYPHFFAQAATNLLRFPAVFLPGGVMFKRIVVALNDRPESHRAFETAIDLARTLQASLATLSVLEDMPAYATYAIAVEPNASSEWRDEQLKAQSLAHEKAKEKALSHGLSITSHFVEGREVKSIVRFLKEHQADLFVVGLHQHDFYIARFWNTIYDLAQEAPCSMLGVH